MAPQRSRPGRDSQIAPGDYLTGVSYLPEAVSELPPAGTGAQHGPSGAPPQAPHPPTGGQPTRPTRSPAGRALGVLVVLVVAVVLAIVSGSGGSDDDAGPDTGSPTEVDDASIARLSDNCTAGYWPSCEQLAEWPTASDEDRAVGRTCGGRTDGTVDCRTLDQDDASASPSADDRLTDEELQEVWADLLASGALTDQSAGAFAGTGIDVPRLLATLQGDCLDHDRDACLHLRELSVTDPTYLVGALRTLRAECTAGDDEACTLLGVVADEGTEDRALGRSCGGRAAPETCT